MHIRIVCPEYRAYEGDAAFVSIPSTDGSLGILPRHASEICTIESGRVRISDVAMGTVDHVFAVSSGYAQIADDNVILLVDRAQDLADVDKDAVRQQMRGFEDHLGNLSKDDAQRSYLYNEVAWCKLLLAD